MTKPYYEKCVDDITLTIDPDDHESADPRDNDNLGTMICMHNRYTLGDSKHYALPEEQRLFFNDQGEPVEDEADAESYGSLIISGSGVFKEAEQSLWFLKLVEAEGGVVMPLYLYDHGGVTMSTSTFSDPWDSGVVGYIYVTRAKLVEEYGDASEETKTTARNVLESEVKEYAMFLEGDVWKFEITSPNEDECDSCHGILGYENCESEAEASLTAIVEARCRGLAAREDR